MIKNLVIVESPAKAKTIEKFLGKDYKVMSSYGHIRDLKKKNFGIDIDANFMPVYEIPADKTTLVNDLKKAAAEAEMVWLASDEDREGEAIAWHLYEVLGLKPETTRRIVFHEITEKAIRHAIANPRDIDLNLVDAQQARRVLDRIVGFELSPVLWKKIKPQLSAGRVQSVAVRLIVEREKEIRDFKAETYYRVVAEFTDAAGATFHADLTHRLADVEQARALLQSCNGAAFTVADVQVRPLHKSPAPPFTTSTLQQEAARKLGFTVAQTMSVAQRLYEAGHITYMRTDSLNLSTLAIDAISKEITAEMGEKYLKVRKYHTSSKGAQEAHEAIRPTYIEKHSISGTSQEQRLYNLIWKRTIASQMADAEIEKTTVDVATDANAAARFVATGEVIKFDGFLKVYIESRDDEAEEENRGLLPKLNVGDHLDTAKMTATQRYTQQPPRYTEASLVKKLEDLGIGRPSTYAPTISTIQQREYVERGDRPGEERQITTLTLRKGKITEKTTEETYGSEKAKLVPTDIGTVVNDFLTEYFPDILDFNFTAKVERKFDDIAEGDLKWNTEIAEFYRDFHPTVVDAESVHLDHKVGERVLGTDPATGDPVSVKIGRFGPMVQIGEVDRKNKPRFASLLAGQSISDLTLEEALKLFEFPRHLGQYEGKEVTVAVGRFGPYVRHDGKFVSIPKDVAPLEISLEAAIDLIEAKRESDLNRTVKVFDEDPDMQILNGRFGIYIAYKKKNYKIPKGTPDPANLSLEECRAIVEAQDAAPRATGSRRTSSRNKKS